MGGTSTKDLDYSETINKNYNNPGQDEDFPAEMVGNKSKYISSMCSIATLPGVQTI